MSTLSEMIARRIAPNAVDPLANVVRWVSDGMVTTEEAVTYLMDFAYREGVKDAVKTTIENRV